MVVAQYAKSKFLSLTKLIKYSFLIEGYNWTRNTLNKSGELLLFLVHLVLDMDLFVCLFVFFGFSFLVLVLYFPFGFGLLLVLFLVALGCR
jgi:hypothetical protein